MKYHSTFDDNSLRCEVCPRRCITKKGQRGFCKVRENKDGKIVSTVYAKTTGLAVDPVEKKPLYHFLPSSDVLSFGTTGCNMGCMFCQNYTTTKFFIDPELLINAAPYEIVNAAKRYGCKSIAFTYNDPVVFLEYAIDTAKEAKKEGLKTIAVSAGYINNEPAKELFSYMDAVNIDLKGFSEEFYAKNCLAHIKPVLDTLKYIKDNTNTWLEVTTLLIEGENDSDEILKNEFLWIKENLGENTPLHLSAFYPAYKFKDKKPTPSSTLIRAYNLAKSYGLNYIYTGNIKNLETSITYCKNCSTPLIVRDGYKIVQNNLDADAKCIFCSTVLDGVF